MGRPPVPAIRSAFFDRQRAALFFDAIAQRQQRERRRQVGVFFAELAVAGVAPTAVGVLSLFEGLQQFLAPGVFFAAAVGERLFAQGVHRLGEGVVVVIKAGLLHAGV